MFKRGDKIVCIDNKGIFAIKRSHCYLVADDTTDNWVTVKLPSGTVASYPVSCFQSTEDKGNHTEESLPLTDSASKHDTQKIDLSLIPKIALEEMAKAFMVGEKKYGRYNYCKGHKASQLVAAAMRHLTTWFEREEHDPKDGQHHLGSVMACCAMILRQQQLKSIKDDRYEGN